ncbi:hypothetical protein F2P56_034972 [Juglans regia]|uniref:Auxin efflux carrier component n=2 Tax=Juglans regia TaxID=51240 RepID=A0A2I4H4K3_JUGRE|nr:auxin efflux carrier component 3-like [Juglans regia]KAF5442301.1 hypothetical protein F2P56_034972 [Juglans regia]
MITWGDLYTVLTAVIPLYVAMILAYGSVRWWKIFSPDQCSGINRFVAIFAVPLLSFHFISENDPYSMNFRFIAADTLQKIIMLVVLTIWTNFTKNGSLEWMITIFSLSTLPNTLVMGIPLLKAMYGDYSGSLMVQVVVLQCIIWYTLLLFLFEYRGAKMLIMEQFPETAASIVSFKVDSDVVSLDGRDFLETDAEIGDDGKLHIKVRKSNASRRSLGGSAFTPRPSNLTGAEIYSLSSSRNPTPRGSNFNNSDLYSMMGYQGFPAAKHSNSDLYSVQSSRGPTPRPSSFEENCGPIAQTASSPRFGFYPSQTVPAASYPAPNPEFSSTITKSSKNQPQLQPQSQQQQQQQAPNSKANHDAKELHMFVWSSSESPVSEGDGLQVLGASEQSGRFDQGAKEIRMLVADQPPNGENKGFDEATTEREGFGAGEDLNFAGRHEVEGDVHQTEREKDGTGPIELNKLGSSSTAELHPKYVTGAPESGVGKQMPPASVMTRLILIMVWRKLIRNPNTYSSLIGLVWSLVVFRWHVAMPKIIEESISILSNAGLGMAMFSLGLFMALQPNIIACGNSVAAFAMAVRFLTGPAVMAAASIAIGLRGTLLHIAIVQAALPQGIVPFVFAKEYNVHPAILSTGVIFGMLIALPITLVYYIVLRL